MLAAILLAALAAFALAGRILPPGSTPDGVDSCAHGDLRLALQIPQGDMTFALWPDVAPKTVAHIVALASMGAYDTNHIFRVEKGFVAQIADVVGGRERPLHRAQRAAKHVPAEFTTRYSHQRGTLSMARFDDPDSGTSSFSILLGNATHLNSKYTIFGAMLDGDDVLDKVERVEVVEGPWHNGMKTPKDRIPILSAFTYRDPECPPIVTPAPHDARDSIIAPVQPVLPVAIPPMQGSVGGSGYDAAAHARRGEASPAHVSLCAVAGATPADVDVLLKRINAQALLLETLRDKCPALLLDAS